MKNIEKITNGIADLLGEGSKLLEDGQKKDYSVGHFAPRYECWYTNALSVVTQIIPERLPEFKEAYRHERRKDITYDTYTISDFLLGLQVTRNGVSTFNTASAFAHKLIRQIGILNAAKMSASSVLRDIRSTLRAEILDSDLYAARSLLKAGHLRSAGMVSGVVIEAHLQAICDRHAIKVTKKNPSISDFNDLLKDANVYDVPTWRLVQRLADIRNLCGHRKERDPKPDEVDDLISGVDKITKEIG